jgi:drug/metabolite transporter (DMT)-like permease
MTGELYALLTLISWTIAIRSFAKASTIFDPAAVNKARMLLALVLLFAIYIIFIDHHVITIFSTLKGIQFFWLGLSGFLGLAVGDLFAFIAYKHIGATKTSLLSTIAPASALISSILLINETIDPIGIIGMAITTSGIILLILKKQSADEPKLNGWNSSIGIGIIGGLAAGITQGVGMVLTKKAMLVHEVHPIHASFIRILFGFLLLIAFDLITKRHRNFIRPFINEPKKTGYVLLGTLFGPIVGVSCSIAAISTLKVSIAQTIFSLVPVTVLVYGVLFMGEKISWGIIISTIIALVGVMILVWRTEIALMF